MDLTLVIELWTRGLLWDNLLGTFVVNLSQIPYSNTVREFFLPKKVTHSSSAHNEFLQFYALIVLNWKSQDVKRRLIYSIKVNNLWSAAFPLNWSHRVIFMIIKPFLRQILLSMKSYLFYRFVSVKNCRLGRRKADLTFSILLFNDFLNKDKTEMLDKAEFRASDCQSLRLNFVEIL